MSVDSKIKSLLERVNAKASVNEAEQMGASSSKKDSTISPKNPGDSGQPKQGDSENASFESRDEKDANQGSIAAKGVNKNDLKMKSAPGQAPNFTTVANQPANAVNQSSSQGMREEEEKSTEDVVSETTEVQKIDLSSIFGEDLSEEFKTKATSIFEAAVIARVNSEMEKVSEALETKFTAELTEAKDAMVEKIDSYLNYVVENWMAENELAIENGLRTEIAEDFIAGLKVLFKEHYIEVPEEKYDVISELQAKSSQLEEKLNEAIGTNVTLSKTVIDLKRAAIEEELSNSLADTESAKLKKLLEGVEFESESLYREKVSVIKENYFPKSQIKESQVPTQQQHLIEETNTEATDTIVADSTVNAYAAALSRSIKRA